MACHSLYTVPIKYDALYTMEPAVSSHSRSVHESHPSTSQGTPRGGSRRGLLYIVAIVLVGVLFVLAAESHARQIEYLREFGVAVEGTVTEINVLQSGGRQPGYWIAGTYPAISPAGRDVILPFRFNITKAEYDTYTQGDTLALIYDPENYNEPLRAGHYGQSESGQIRMIAAIVVMIYAVVGVLLAVVDQRRQTRRSAESAKLRRAFGSR
jgi:hypothetical protein